MNGEEPDIAFGVVSEGDDKPQDGVEKKGEGDSTTNSEGLINISKRDVEETNDTNSPKNNSSLISISEVSI